MSYLDYFEHTIVTSPPRSLETSSSDWLIISEPSQRCVSSFEEETGFVIDKKGLSGWLKIKESVTKHVDSYGKCFVYCRTGGGILWLENKPIHLTEGFYTIFDDRKEHSFDLLTRMCTLFVANVKGTPLPHIRKSAYYVK